MSSTVESMDFPDAELQCQQLADMLRPEIDESSLLVGVYSGGAWVAERLCALLNLPLPEADNVVAEDSYIGYLDISFYRDDFREKGLHQQVKPSMMPVDLTGRRVILVDDVLYTGRTTRAALNEIFDYGRPASVTLAVLADRGGRELPVYAAFSVWAATVPPDQVLVLSKSDNRLLWTLEEL